ncbi:MAG: 6-phosphofructokinase [Candidatus Paceibacterota bacterium]|jgi:6-phosphofructokinase 1|nr:6-phosphofructokinase [Candidatus Paceibacterota bacterium]
MKQNFSKDPNIRRIALITSGGDCGGLNAFLYAAIMTCLNQGIEPIVIPSGNVGMYNLIDYKTDEIVPADIAFAESIDITRAGSEAGNTRVKIHKIDHPNAWERVHKGLEKHSIDALIVCGGDGSGREVLRYVDHSIRCVHAPKTMDLDLQTYSVGADSAINKIAKVITDAKTTGSSHGRILITEVFGAKTGHIALGGGVAAQADAILIPEVDYDLKVVYQHMKQTLFDRFSRSKNHTGTYVIVVAEGLKETEKHLGSGGATGAGAIIAKRLNDIMKADAEIRDLMKQQRMFVPGANEVPEIRDVVPLYIARSGETSAYDINFGLEIGAGAIYATMQGLSGITILGVNKRQVKYMQTKDAILRREVSKQKVALFESMGFCFGRQVEPFEPVFNEVKEPPVRLY